MHKYFYQPTPHFSDRLEKISRQDPPGHARILKVIDRLLVDPSDADGWMHGLFHGRLKKYVGRRDYRLIYHWCDLCRKQARHLENRCGYCGSIPDHSVIFFEIYHKNEANKL
ncbi:MAG: toxin [Desulfuromonadales bacterium]|jgi:hypothetical protein